MGPTELKSRCNPLVGEIFGSIRPFSFDINAVFSSSKIVINPVNETELLNVLDKKTNPQA